MKRIITLFTVPRAGSTPISEILGYYFQQCFNYIHLPEYLSYNQTGVTYERGAIGIDGNSWKPYKEFYKGMTSEEFCRIQTARIQLLKKSNYNYFLKVFPFQAGPHRKWLFENSKVLFLYRENLFEHMLSYLISESLGIYYESDGIQLSDEKLVAEYELFFRFLRLATEFRNLRRRYPHNPCLCFEKDFKKSPEQILAQLGFNKSINWNRLKLPEKQNKSNKLKVFKNKNEILNWYTESVLNEYYPIEKSEMLQIG